MASLSIRVVTRSGRDPENAPAAFGATIASSASLLYLGAIRLRMANVTIPSARLVSTSQRARFRNAAKTVDISIASDGTWDEDGILVCSKRNP
jgi:hypothetical protein